MSTEQPEEDDLLATARENPEEIDVDNLAKLLEHQQNQTRNVALITMARLAVEDPDRVVDHTDAVIDRLTDEFPVAQSSAAHVLAQIAPEHPEAVLPAIPRLVEMLDQDPPLTGFRAGKALAPLLDHAPEDFVDVTDDLLAIFDDLPDPALPSDEDLQEMDPEIRQDVKESLESRREEAENDIKRCLGIREITVHALVEVTDVAPEAVGDRIVEIRPIFTAEPPIARAAAMDVVANVAQHDPAAVEPLVEDVIEMAQTETRQIRVHAIQALGHAGATEAVEPLREIADSDEDVVSPQLRDLALETAEFLESQD